MAKDKSTAAAQTGTVHVSRPADGVVRLEIDNPPMNALGARMCATMIETFETIGADPTTRAVILTGRGPAFCAGADLKGESVGRGFGAALAAVAASRAPVVAAINGHCIGGGLELALCCDLRVASKKATFTAAGVNMGLMASAYRLPRLIGVARAKAMLLTGSPHDAKLAELWGLVTATYNPADVEPAALALARRIASRAPLSVEATKRISERAPDLSPTDAAALEAEEITVLRASRDHVEAVTAFREKRQPLFTRS